MSPLAKFVTVAGALCVSLAMAPQGEPPWRRCQLDQRSCTTEYKACPYCVRCDGSDLEDLCNGIVIENQCDQQEDFVDDCGFWEYGNCDAYGVCVNWHYGSDMPKCPRMTCFQ